MSLVELLWFIVNYFSTHLHITKFLEDHLILSEIILSRILRYFQHAKAKYFNVMI